MKMKDVLKGMSTPKLIATLFESLRDRNVAESREFIKEATAELSKRPPIQGPKGDKGDPGVGAPLINNLEAGGTDAALTAEMGREIKSQLDEIMNENISYPVVIGIEEVDDVINIKKPYGDVMRYGAVSDFDGINGTDNSFSFQKALDYSALLGVEVFVPSGKYLISKTLTIPDYITIKGVRTVKNPYRVNDVGFYGTVIYTNCKNVFINTNQIARCELTDLIFINKNYRDRSILFKNIDFKDSLIRISTLDYSIVFYGSLSLTSYISNCNFMGVSECFIYSHNTDENDDDLFTGTPGIIDSFIVDSYINGKRNSHPATCFNISVMSHSTISNCFFDYFKNCFKITKQSKLNTITSSTFDVIYNVFINKSNSGLIVNSCNFSKISYIPSIWTELTDEEMINNSWVVFKSNTTDLTFNKLTISSNNIENVDVFADIGNNIYNVYDISISNNKTFLCNIEGVIYKVKKEPK